MTTYRNRRDDINNDQLEGNKADTRNHYDNAGLRGYQNQSYYIRRDEYDQDAMSRRPRFNDDPYAYRAQNRPMENRRSGYNRPMESNEPRHWHDREAERHPRFMQEQRPQQPMRDEHWDAPRGWQPRQEQPNINMLERMGHAVEEGWDTVRGWFGGHHEEHPQQQQHRAPHPRHYGFGNPEFHGGDNPFTEGRRSFNNAYEDRYSHDKNYGPIDSEMYAANRNAMGLGRMEGQHGHNTPEIYVKRREYMTDRRDSYPRPKPRWQGGHW